MKTVFSIFINDMKGIRKNLIMFVMIIGISILPALYAWFNIAAGWDPYSNTSGLKFAVCSLDEGFQFKELSINAGNSIVENLKQNDQIGWVFVDGEDDAIDGTKHGEYYAAVVIPRDFSANLLSLVSGKFDRANLDYYVNEKVNAVSPKITDKGVEAIEQAVDEAFVSKLSESVATALNATGTEMDEKKESIISRIQSGLEDTKSNVEMIISSVDLLISTLDSVDGMLKSTKEMEPVIRKTLSKAGVMVEDVKGAMESAQSTSKQLVPTIENILHSMDAGAEDIVSRVEDAFEDIETDPASTATKLRAAETIIRKKISVNEELISIFNGIQANLGVNCALLIKPLENSNKKANSLIDKIESVCKKLDKGETLSDSVKSELITMSKEINDGIDTVKTQFDSMKKSIENKLEKSFSSMDGVADFAQTLSSGTDQLDAVFKNTEKMNGNLKKVLGNLKEFLNKTDKKIDEFNEKINDPNEIDSLENFIRPIIENPNKLGEFISSPVSETRHSIGQIANYGSAMSPFYTSLAIWVGGIVLVAVVSVDLSERDRKKFPNAGPNVVFFGRYITFFLIGQLQALLIGLGDIFLLKAQVENPWLFILVCLISSFVYTMFIYSITVTFSVIGKALAVIVLVLQVAGSGGTFPVPLLAKPFQAIAPYLPFSYGVPAMRETVAGADTSVYWECIGKLLIFLIPSLVIGLMLRKPCLRLIRFFNHKIDESDLII